jgi:hypothetical protein
VTSGRPEDAEETDRWEAGKAAQPPQPVDSDGMKPYVVPPTTPPRPGGGWRRHSRWLFPLLALVVGLLVGGTAARSTPDDDAASARTSTVTSTACVEALAKAEDVMGLDDQGFAIAGEAMRAAGELDSAKIEEQTGKLQTLTPLKQSASAAYATAAKACRGSS